MKSRMKQMETLRCKPKSTKKFETYYQTLKSTETKIDLMLQNEHINNEINKMIILIREYEGLTLLENEFNDEPYS
tara:strand:+ start:354 stop:578 length:225 start_codon:yes stop_codon:yes gene_type:complete